MKRAVPAASDLAGLPAPPPGTTGWPWKYDQPEAFGLPAVDVNLPRLSVITPSLNLGKFIEAAIRSVLLQEYPNLEYIIVDGGSTDKTLDIIKKYAPWLAHWESEKDRGQSHAVNKGIERSTGEIIFWLNADDICLPGAFQRAMQVFRDNPSVAMVGGQAQVIDEEGHEIGRLRSYFSSWAELATNPGNSVRQISTFFRRRLFDEYGLLDEGLSLAMDADLMVRFTRQNSPVILDECLAAFRMHAESKSSRAFGAQYAESDRLRPRMLQDRQLVKEYRRRSSRNWLHLSENKRLGLIARFGCIVRAVRNRPAIVLSRDFIRPVRLILRRLLPVPKTGRTA